MVVQEIEKDGLTIYQYQLKCGIMGGQTIQNWIKKIGKNHLLNKIIRVETKQQTSEIQLLKKELKALKEAYTDAMLELKVHQEIIKVSDEILGTDLKKVRTSVLKNLSKTQKIRTNL